MRVVICYESMYGATHRVADAVASGFREADEVTTVPVSALTAAELDCDLLIVGVPTHAHGLPRPATRQTAVTAAGARDVEPSAAGSGVREWLDTLPERIDASVASFDTRFRPPGWLVGHPARRVSHRLRRRGAVPLARPESFYVDRDGQLFPGELQRARRWGEQLREQAARTTAIATR